MKTIYAIKNEKLAEKYGFKYNESSNSGEGYVKNSFHIWRRIDTPSLLVWWQTASLINGYYRGHKRFDSFEEALAHGNQ